MASRCDKDVGERLLFRVPLEPESPTLIELLTRAWFEGTPEQIEAVLASGEVRVEDRSTRNPKRRLSAGDLILVRFPWESVSLRRVFRWS